MDKSERESRKKWTPLIYQAQEICPWTGKIYTTTKHNNPDVTALRTHYIHNKHNCSVLALSHCPFSRFFHIHICCPCARLTWSPPRWTQGVGPKPKMGIYEATSALSETNARVGQDGVVLVACGRDPALRRGGGGTNTERKDICSLSFNRAVRGNSFFAQRLVYLCWKEAQKHISYSSGNDKHPSV